MSPTPRRLILASKSPRRHDLLSKMGFVFTVDAPDVDENIQGAPCEMVKLLSERKAMAVCVRYDYGWIVAADTLVALDDKALGKPKDEEDAFRMLSSLSGKKHQVYTGICLMDAKTGDCRDAPILPLDLDRHTVTPFLTPSRSLSSHIIPD